MGVVNVYLQYAAIEGNTMRELGFVPWVLSMSTYSAAIEGNTMRELGFVPWVLSMSTYSMQQLMGTP